MATITTHLIKRPVNAYISLAKPRGILPHFITAAAAMFLAAGGIPPSLTLVYTLLGGGLVAGAANTFNSYYDKDIDALMARTCRRPLPSGYVKPGQALVFGVSLGLAGVIILNMLVNWQAAVLAVIALAYYVLPYTLWLKRRTYWSVIVGSGIGAIPPLIGWVAITQRLEPTPFLLSLIIILWTLPHFWTLAVFRRDDYARAGLKMLPEKGTAWWIIVPSFMLAAATLLLIPAAAMGYIYTGTACILSTGFVFLAWRMHRKDNIQTAKSFYVYTIFYIAALFGTMIIDIAIS